MWSPSVIVTPPAALPLAVADVRAHCYADPGGADDSVLGAYLAAAVDTVQAITGLRLITQTVQLTRRHWGDGYTGRVWENAWGRWGGPMRFPIGPVQSVAFTYLDPTETQQTLDASTYAFVSAGSLAPEVALVGGKWWPPVYDHPAAITCTATVGYGADGTSVPGSILQAIKLLVGDYFANREDTIAERSVVPATLPNGVDRLLANFRIW